jgi:hypothetical protein
MARGTQQQGMVLVVSLIMLLLVTLIVFAASRSSALDVRLAGISENKVATFQAAESAVTRVTSDIVNLGAPSRTATPMTMAFDFSLSDTKSARVNTTQVFRAEAAAPGYSVRRGSAGFQTFFYDIRAEAQTLPDSSIRTTIVEGVFIEAPRTN